MVVHFECIGDVCVLRLEGRFATGQDAEYLRSRTEELRGRGYQKIVADFSAVAYIDSTGIGFLIGIYTSVLKSGTGMFVLAAPNKRVQEVLKLTKLDTILQIYPDVDKALEGLSSAAAT